MGDPESDMGFVFKKIDVFAYFYKGNNYPTPVRFRYNDEDGGEETVVIDKVLSVKEDKSVPGIFRFMYNCQSYKNGLLYLYQLCYDPKDSHWMLYKI